MMWKGFMIKSILLKKQMVMRVFIGLFVGAIMLTNPVIAAEQDTPTELYLGVDMVFVYPETQKYAVEKNFPSEMHEIVNAEIEKRKDKDGRLIGADMLGICAMTGYAKDLNKCNKFQHDLDTRFYNVCSKDKGKSGGTEHCVDDFFYESFFTLHSKDANTYVRTWEAINLAKEYAAVKTKQTVDCRPSNLKSNVILCSSVDHKHFYEFKFNDIKETVDSSIRSSVLSALCRLHNMEYKEKRDLTLPNPNPLDYWPHHCRATKGGAEISCNSLEKTLSKFSYKSELKPLTISADLARSTNRPMQEYICAIDQIVTDKTKLRTAYNLDPKIFSVVQHVLGTETVDPIKRYVQKELTKQGIKFNAWDFYCAGSTNLISNGEIITCYVNGKPVDFLFGDLSEGKKINKRGSQQAIDCIDSGGNYTGERCTHLTKEQCLLLRSANLQNCPECKLIQWEGDEFSGVCTLPSSVAANKFTKRLNIAAIVGGGIASVVITVTMPEFDVAAAGGWIILGVETSGTAIEWWSQVKIDGFADEFFLKANNCKNEDCAKTLVTEYLQELARLGAKNDLTDAEFRAADFEMEYLISLIPAETNAEWYANFLRQEDGKSLLESHKDGHWTTDQVWRAIGIGLQFTGVFSAVGGWIIKNTARMAKGLPRTSQILLKNAEIAEKNFIKYENLSDLDKEFYKLWQEYAPKNQTFNQFKAMSHGNLDEARQMVKNMGGRSERLALQEMFDNLGDDYKQWSDLVSGFEQDKMEINKLMRKHLSDEEYKIWSQKPDAERYSSNTIKKTLNGREPKLDRLAIVGDLEYEMKEITAIEKKLTADQLEQFKNARELEYKLEPAYSTYDPEFSKAFEPRRKIEDLWSERNILFQKIRNDNPGLRRMDEIQQQIANKQAMYGLEDYTDWLNCEFVPLDKTTLKDFEEWRDLEKEYKQLASTKTKISKEDSKKLAELDKQIKQLEREMPDQWEIAERFPLQNINNVVSERANAFADIIESNPEIKAKMAPETWEKLDKDKRVEVAQQILDEYAKRTGTPKVQISINEKIPDGIGGHYRYFEKDIEFNPYAQISRSNGDMLEITSHEHGHMIDHQMPNEGTLGEQYSYYGNKIYSSEKKDGYRVALTEQSSYKIGDNIGYGIEYDLEAARNKVFEKNVDLGVGIGAGATGTVGIEAGVAYIENDKIKSKKNSKKQKKQDVNKQIDAEDKKQYEKGSSKTQYGRVIETPR